MNSTSPRFQTISPKFWKFLFYVPGILLTIFVFVNIGINTQDDLLAQWKVYRNYVYKLYIGLFILLSFLELTKYNNIFRKVFPVAVISLLFTTFSYAIAWLTMDLLNVIQLIITN